MIQQPLISYPPLTQGILIKRYKRFLADVKLDNKKIVTVHCPNTGPMLGLLSENTRVRISYSDSLKRKLSWTLEQVEVESKNTQKKSLGRS